MKDEECYLREAIELAHANAERGGRPFGAVVVKDGEVIATGVNEILATGDPTAHAEMLAIRAASRKLGSASLAGCAVYASGQPCPMCTAAMRLAGILEAAYAYSSEEGAAVGLANKALFEDLAKPPSEQAMKMRYVPVRLPSRPDLYAEWKGRQPRQP